MALSRSASHDSRIKAVLGPTNTGKTHFAIERLCAHSSGAMGFPLRLLAREVYDRVCSIKGIDRVALITGEERILPPKARWFLCTAEAMPLTPDGLGTGREADLPKDFAFIALDEAQLGADRERGHIFTDRLLHARGREETMILGSATLEPLVKALVPEAEIVTRPRFSTLSHAGARKLSRIPPRSAVVAFSAEHVYIIAEMLRRFRGGAAVVMGAMSPQTRNAQVALYQSGEVDYLVATDAIGMGLNLDIEHVAFAGLSKFDGQRQRRLTTAEMAQIAGRAGRHQRDGTFGTLSGTRGHDAIFSDEEVHSLEEHRLPPLTNLFWREAEPRRDSLDQLIGDLESLPNEPGLAPAPEAIDLAVLKRLAEEPDIAATVRGRTAVTRFWQVCSLPDFRQLGIDNHARFVARLWEDLRRGCLGADFVAARIAELDNPSGDIDTLQGRIAAIRTWSYIAQRPDWVLARDEMADRARRVEVRLSDALHARLTERFVNRRTALLMRKLGPDGALLPVALEGNALTVDGETIGRVEGFRFVVDSDVRHDDRKLLLAAAEKHLPALLTKRAEVLAREIAAGEVPLTLNNARISWNGFDLVRLQRGPRLLSPRLLAEPALRSLAPDAARKLMLALERWLAEQLAALAPLARLEEAGRAPDSGPELRALLIRLVEHGGMCSRSEAGVDGPHRDLRHSLSRLGVIIGSLDLFVPAMLKHRALTMWGKLSALESGPPAEIPAEMPPVLPASERKSAPGYRRLGTQCLRIDMAEKLLCAAHAARVAALPGRFGLDPALARSMGLTTASFTRLLRLGGFKPIIPRALPPDTLGPVAPLTWSWRSPYRRQQRNNAPIPRVDNAFARLAELVA